MNPPEALEQSARFEELFSQLSVRLINLGLDDINTTIEEGLKLVGTFAKADEVRLLAVAERVLEDRFACAWVARGNPADLACSTLEFFDRFPVAQALLRAGKPMMFGSLNEIPAQALQERSYLESIGLLAAIAYPVIVDAELIAVLFIHRFQETRWPKWLVARLPQVAALLGNALARKQAQTQLQQQLEFETLLTDISAGFIKASPAVVDAEVETTLAKMGELFKADRVFVTHFSDEKIGAAQGLTYGWIAQDLDKTDPLFQDLLFDQAFPWMTAQLRSGKVFHFPAEQLPAEAVAERSYVRQAGIEASILIPLVVGGSVTGALILDSFHAERRWSPPLVQRLSVVGEIIASAFQRKQALAEVQTLKDRLEEENLLLREEIELHQSHDKITGNGAAIRRVKAQIERVAPTDSTVLILGETGTGKELVANALHRLSSRASKPVIRVNCAALPEALIEAELFGREKGAYTGALTRQVGRFEVADGGTLFLDEIGELPLGLQSKLLRVLQEGEFERLGSVRTIRVDVRLIAATNRDLEQAVREGRFREDLYYRLNVFPIDVPPLRDRTEDIPAIVWKLIGECCEQTGRTIRSVPNRDMMALQTYAWPGNVRELRNLIERALILCQGATLHIDLPGRTEPYPAVADDETLDAVERAHVAAILARTGWRIRGDRGAAAILGIKPTTLEYRIKKLGLKRPSAHSPATPG